jgi:hypothetical protein
MALQLYGNPNQWSDIFPAQFIPQILKLIVDTWSKCPKPNASDYEDPITEKFVTALRQSKLYHNLPFFINYQFYEISSQPPERSGRIDICFSPGSSEHVYFAFECKRLRYVDNSGFRSNTSEYVGRDGMMCFVTGKYASKMSCGGMLGYVMDGDISAAISSVEKALMKGRHHIRVVGTQVWKVPKGAPIGGIVKQSKHQLRNRIFTIYHVFLPA